MRGCSTTPRAAGAVAVGSSEGGLFEYGSDDAIEANLDCGATRRAAHFAMVGSVTRADDRSSASGRPAARDPPRGLTAFRALAARCGWAVDG